MVSAQDMPSVFERLSSPKTWAEDDLRKLIDVIIAEKAITHTPGDLAKMSLGEQNGSPFTQRIAEAPPPHQRSLPCQSSIFIIAEQT